MAKNDKAVLNLFGLPDYNAPQPLNMDTAVQPASVSERPTQAPAQFDVYGRPLSRPTVDFNSPVPPRK